MINRRQVLAGIGIAGATSLTGCMDLLQDGVEAEASLAIVEESVVDETDYSYVDAEAHVIDETFEVADESRDVHVTSWGATYTKNASDLEHEVDGDSSDYEGDAEELFDQDAAGYVVISTPSVAIAGQEINPVGRMDNEEIIEEFNNELTSGKVKDISKVDEHPIKTLDEVVPAIEFDALVETEDGDTYEVKLYVTEVENEDDIILGIGLFPQGVDEEENVLKLTENLEHPVNSPPEE